MIESVVEKIFAFIIPEGHCECCGMPCKTALCQSCQEELNSEMDEVGENPNQTKIELVE